MATRRTSTHTRIYFVQIYNFSILQHSKALIHRTGSNEPSRQYILWEKKKHKSHKLQNIKVLEVFAISAFYFSTYIHFLRLTINWTNWGFFCSVLKCYSKWPGFGLEAKNKKNYLIPFYRVIIMAKLKLGKLQENLANIHGFSFAITEDLFYIL